MAAPLVSIVVLNWNGGAAVLDCLRHAAGQSWRPLEIIVVDNGSTDGSLAVVSSEYPDLRTVVNAENRGFATGMNQGIDAARGDYLVLLNQDVVLHAEFVARAVRAMQSAGARTGMIAGKIMKLDGGQPTPRVTGGATALGRSVRPVSDPQVDAPHVAFAPTWCSPFLSAEMLRDVRESTGHCFDDRYFTYGEDLDLSIRAQLRGWDCVYDPTIEAWHEHGSAHGGRTRVWDKPEPWRTFALRNRYFTIVKDLPFDVLLRLAPWLVGIELLLWPYVLLRHPRSLGSLVRAYVQVLRHLPANLGARRRVLATRRASGERLWRHVRGW